MELYPCYGPTVLCTVVEVGSRIGNFHSQILLRKKVITPSIFDGFSSRGWNSFIFMCHTSIFRSWISVIALPVKTNETRTRSLLPEVEEQNALIFYGEIYNFMNHPQSKDVPVHEKRPRSRRGAFMIKI